MKKSNKTLPEMVTELLSQREASTQDAYEKYKDITTKPTIRNVFYRLNKSGEIEETGEFKNRHKVYRLKSNGQEQGTYDPTIGDLKFLMDFFQRNKTLLKKNNIKYLRENHEKFTKIAQKIEKKIAGEN